MTKEEILKLRPGPELGKLVAERVMGWKRTSDGAPPGCAYWKDKEGKVRAFEDPGGDLDWQPFTNIRDAWDVVEELLSRDLQVWFTSAKRFVEGTRLEWYWLCSVHHLDWRKPPRNIHVRSRDLPLAVCRAALLAALALEGGEDDRD